MPKGSKVHRTCNSLMHVSGTMCFLFSHWSVHFTTMCLTPEVQPRKDDIIIFISLTLPCFLPGLPPSTATPACHCTCAPRFHAATSPGLAADWQLSPACGGIHSPSPWTGQMHACCRWKCWKERVILSKQYWERYEPTVASRSTTMPNLCISMLFMNWVLLPACAVRLMLFQGKNM